MNNPNSLIYKFFPSFGICEQGCQTDMTFYDVRRLEELQDTYLNDRGNMLLRDALQLRKDLKIRATKKSKHYNSGISTNNTIIKINIIENTKNNYNLIDNSETKKKQIKKKKNIIKKRLKKSDDSEETSIMEEVKSINSKNSMDDDTLIIPPKNIFKRPKRALTPFILFYKENATTLRKEFPHDITRTEFSKALSKKWQQLESDKKTYYENLADEDKFRYFKEKQQYLLSHTSEEQLKGQELKYTQFKLNNDDDGDSFQACSTNEEDDEKRDYPLHVDINKILEDDDIDFENVPA